jgi:hypothetical protein
MLGLRIVQMVQNSSTMVYCMTEANLCPPGPPGQRSGNKGSASALPPAAVAPSSTQWRAAPRPLGRWSWHYDIQHTCVMRSAGLGFIPVSSVVPCNKVSQPILHLIAQNIAGDLHHVPSSMGSGFREISVLDNWKGIRRSDTEPCRVHINQHRDKSYTQI